MDYMSLLMSLLPGGSFLGGSNAGGLGGLTGTLANFGSSVGSSAARGILGLGLGSGPMAGLTPPVGPGGTGAGTGSGVGAYQPTTPTPSLGELTAIPQAGAPGVPSGVQQPTPYATPGGGAIPGGTPYTGGGHYAAVQERGHAQQSAMAQFLAEHYGIGQDAMSATVAALQRAAAYHAALLGG
jgi:hypothetical protein